MESAAGALSHRSALCLIPHRTTWAQIQSVRCVHDKVFARWPPHINLLYPFLPDNADGTAFAAAALLACQHLSTVESFQVTLSAVGIFEHRKSCTVWLDPRSKELLQLQGTLQAAFPQCKDLSNDPGRGITAFTPHLSLGQWRTAAEACTAKQALERSWVPSTFTVDHVALISRRSFQEPFRIRWQVPLRTASCNSAASEGPLGDSVEGRQSAPREVNVPYIAS